MALFDSPASSMHHEFMYGGPGIPEVAEERKPVLYGSLSPIRLPVSHCHLSHILYLAAAYMLAGARDLDEIDGGRYTPSYCTIFLLAISHTLGWRGFD